MTLMYVNIVFLLSLNKMAAGRSSLNIVAHHNLHSTEKKVFLMRWEMRVYMVDCV